jgi:hypothetical protein
LGVFALLLPVGSSAASDEDQGFRWDIVNLDFAAGTVSPGGVASALANDGSKITLTGSGTFERGEDASGGGTWKTFSSAGVLTGSGTYGVTGFVSFALAPGTLGAVDLIGNVADARAGLATLRISYSDGSKGVLVISCHLTGTPDSVFEGITVSKGFTDFWNRVAPVAGVNAGRTAFHVQ